MDKVSKLDEEIEIILNRLARLDREELNLKTEWHLINVLFAEMHPTAVNCFSWK